MTLRGRPAGGPLLILGGTAEARELAAELVAAGYPVISSLAGRVAEPRRPAGDLRVGGFGGIDGLTEYLRQQHISAVIDATHPFAERITANAAMACRRTGTPHLALYRPAWTPVPGDHWITVADLAAAAGHVSTLPPETAVLLTIGRQEIGRFAAARQRFWLRAVDPPTGARPARCELILARGPFTVDGERDLLLSLGIEMVVTKNSGGPLTAAKLTAARELSLPVVMVARPARPDVTTVTDVPAARNWAQHNVIP